MTVTGQKRPLPPKVVKMKARKRQKIDSGSKVVSMEASRLKVVGEKVRLDELRWDEVAPPDKLDDFEGFFGLEELDGVDVVRDPSNGKIWYEIAGVDVKPTNSSSTSREFQEEQKDGESALNDAEEAVDDEWNGIVDDPTVLDTSKKAEKKSQNLKAKNLIKTNSKNVKTGPDKFKNDIQISNTSFSVLEHEAREADADVSAWKALDLSSETLASLSNLKFSRPTPIQSSAIPHVLAGLDLIGKAPTGSGKTLAFGIPIYEYWLSQSRTRCKGQNTLEKQPTALIILPTRELAHQITEHLTALCLQGNSDGPRIATLTGGLSIQKQRRLLAQADIIVATPGRLWEVISEGHGVLASVQKIKFLVIDEADRLLNEGYFKDLEEVLNALDRGVVDEEVDGKERPGKEHLDRQTLVFSATFAKDLQQKLAKRTYQKKDPSSDTDSMSYLLQRLNFRNTPPKFIDVNPVSQMATNLREGLIECPGTEKDLHLYALLALHYPSTRALVFVNSISAVRRLVPFLQNLGLTPFPLHSQMAQKARLRSIERFTSRPPTKDAKDGSHPAILIATDIAARGLDIPSVDLVVHYHLPRAADTYVHRSGRTARAGNSGSSIVLYSPEEAAGVRRLVAQVHARGSGPTTTGRKGKQSAHHRRHHLQTLDLDKRVVARLKPRAELAKRLADAEQAKEKKRGEDGWLRSAAEELGVEYDSEEFEDAGGGQRGRGRGRRERDRVAREMSKGEMQEARAELRRLLGRRVNVGISERYLTSGGVDVDSLLKEQEEGKVKAQYLFSPNDYGAFASGFMPDDAFLALTKNSRLQNKSANVYGRLFEILNVKIYLEKTRR